MQRKLLVLFIASALIVVSLSSAATTVSATVQSPSPSVNSFWIGKAAAAQFAVPIHLDDGGDTVDEMPNQNFDGTNIIVTAILAQPLKSPTAYLIVGVCFEGEDPVWIKEIEQPTYWGNFLFATAWAPLHIGPIVEWIKIELSWVIMPPTFSTNQVALVLGGGDCARIFIHGGSWNAAQAYASVCLWNRCFEAVSYDALVAHGAIDVQLNAFAIPG